ncbi:FAD-binding oxidoreductase [Roseovarius sp. M141]|uniref:NAD(P)/FAD-dependent oxidoreductase n=1 Tax=Roseovarius sp. M141 TaxID=2583806 RepID=UPI0020CC8B58|nr:FAD-binding oxidoreductase [Roseovarius sp. M141]MCQ0091646.1 FAD-binding oxidoreductase [Roseovarius sp. M141]
MKTQNIIVVGAGICGLSAAIWLRRAGHDVTLIDKDGPGAGASYGNAGLLAEWAVVPVSGPGIAWMGLKYLMSRDAPLSLQWSQMPRLAPWLAQFLRNSTDTRTRRISAALSHLLHDSVDQHRALTRGTRAERWIASSDFGWAYADRAAFEKDAYTWELRRLAGYVPDVIDGPAVREVVPMLGPATNCLVRLKGHGHIVNPGAYMADLAQVLEDEGGTLRRAEMRDVAMVDGRITEVLTDQGPLPCDTAVLAAGIWSEPLARKLGVRVPLVAERGFHLEFKGPSQVPKMPLMMTGGKFAVNPMEQGLRCAGMVELGGTSAKMSRGPLNLLARNVARVFPGLRYDSVEEWMGYRPSTPDSLPLIGEMGVSGVFAAFGHQHIGLTGGPKTGRWVADMIGGRGNADLQPFDANRFRWS